MAALMSQLKSLMPHMEKLVAGGGQQAQAAPPPKALAELQVQMTRLLQSCRYKCGFKPEMECHVSRGWILAKDTKVLAAPRQALERLCGCQRGRGVVSRVGACVSNLFAKPISAARTPVFASQMLLQPACFP
jgi:hypothetical protein